MSVVRTGAGEEERTQSDDPNLTPCVSVVRAGTGEEERNSLMTLT